MMTSSVLSQVILIELSSGDLGCECLTRLHLLALHLLLSRKVQNFFIALG